MSIYRIDDNQIVKIKTTSFEEQKIKERADLQNMLKCNIGVLSPDTLVVSEEFGNWEDSKRRIDLLGIDKEANLVVIELKRTEDGGHMELQAIRYAAMISTLTFDDLVSAYSDYLRDNNDENQDARENLLNFLGWDDSDEDRFGQDVKIILASADFSKELTTSVIWLNDSGLDIQCVRIQPYQNNGEILLDVQSIIPIPEAAEYQVRIREKKQRERESRSGLKDYTKYDVSVSGERYERLNKRRMMFHIVSGVLRQNSTLETVEKIEKATPKKKLFLCLDSELDLDEVRKQIPSNRHDRYFLRKENEVFHIGGKTYLLNNGWGIDTEPAAQAILDSFPDLDIEFKPAD